MKTLLIFFMGLLALKASYAAYSPVLTDMIGLQRAYDGFAQNCQK